MSTLMQIGAALHVSLSDLTMEADEAEVHFIPARERRAIADDHDHKKVLISRKAYGSFEIFVHMIAPSTSNADEPYTHGNAHECLFVLGGEIEAQVGGQTFSLLTGDALEYRSNLPHLVTNRSKKMAEVMFIVGPDETDTKSIDPEH